MLPSDLRNVTELRTKKTIVELSYSSFCSSFRKLSSFYALFRWTRPQRLHFAKGHQEVPCGSS